MMQIVQRILCTNNSRTLSVHCLYCHVYEVRDDILVEEKQSQRESKGQPSHAMFCYSGATVTNGHICVGTRYFSVSH